MCLAVPGQVISTAGNDLLSRTGKVSFSGIVKEASLAFLPEARVGDYVLVHAGFAITRLNEAEAQRSIDYLQSLETMAGQPESPA